MAQITHEVTNASCKGKEDGAIDISIPGGGKYDFEWSNGATTEDLFDIEEGDYTVKIYDKDECVFEKTITVEVDEDKPKVSISGGGERTVCEDSDPEITLYANASECKGCQYQWSNGSSESSTSVTSSGSYSVKVTDEDECFVEESTKVQIKKKDCDDDSDDEVEIPIIESKDPNDIIGPEGVGDSKWVSINDKLPYKIRFENDPDFATAPAVKVVVESPLDEHANIFSFRLGSFGFGSFVFEVPENSTFYTTRLDVIDSLGVVLDVVAGIDVTKRQAFWIFESKDPKTGLPPQNADLGFLLVNDSLTHRGEGFVTYIIKPDDDSNTGDTIHAIADIVFDQNESILTPEIFNTIDAVAPESYVNEMEAEVDTLAFISIFAEDDYGAGGSGVANYDLFISEDDGVTFTLLEENIPINTVYEFRGEPGISYCMYSVASDSVGNTEIKGIADVCFTVRSRAHLALISPEGLSTYCSGASIPILWENRGVENVILSFSSDGGNSYQTIAEDVSADDLAYTWELPADMLESTEYLIRIQDMLDEEIFDVTDTVLTIRKTIQVQITSSNGANICQNSTTELNAGDGFTNYNWSTGATDPIVEASLEGDYIVEVTDVNGCVSADTFNLRVHPVPEKPVVTASGETTFCPSDSLLLSTSTGFESYLWSNLEQTESIYVKATGDYTVTVSTEFGCSTTSDAITITVEDNINPVIESLSDISQSADSESCGATIIINQPTATDNCGIASIENNFNQSPDASGFYPIGTTSVVWTITDNSGNVTLDTMIVIVVDSLLPSIIPPADIVQIIDVDTIGALVAIDLPIVEDNCGVISVINDYTNTDDASGFYPIGTTIVTWTVIDEHGNENQEITRVTVTKDNDYQEHAIDVSSLINSCSSDAVFSNINATGDGVAGSAWNTNPDYNVWFKFQATTEHMKMTIDRGDTKGTIRRVNAAIWEADGTSEITSKRYIGNDDDVVVEVVNTLTPGNWYYISVDNNYANYKGSFTLCLADNDISYDFYEGAIDVSAQINTCSDEAAYTTYGMTGDKMAGSAWNTNPDNNVWLKFQATTEHMKMTIDRGDTKGTIRRVNAAIWEADGTSEITSKRYIGNDDDVVVEVVNTLTPGNWYYISVDNNYANYKGSFTLCLADNDISYDFYEGAIDVSAQINTCSDEAAYTTYGMTGDKMAGSAWNTNPDNNVWFKFQATTEHMKMTIDRGDTKGTIRRVNAAIWEADGTSEITSKRYIGNDDDVVVEVVNTLTPGNWYYISVDNNYANYKGSFTLCLADNDISYDFYEGALDVSTQINSCSNDAAYTTYGMTGDKIAGSEWNTNPDNNVWFKFQATTEHMKMTIDRGDTKGTIRRVNAAIWEADGTSEITSKRYIGNDDDVVVEVVNTLTPGNWYYISVDNNYANYKGSFTLCLNDMNIESNFKVGTTKKVSDVIEITHDDAGYEVKVFPNPTTGKVRLEFGGYKVEQIEVVDMNGKSVYTKKSQIQPREIIDLSDNLNGMYLIYIINADKTMITKTIIKNE